MRQIVLDTETTGLEVGLGHRIIEIGCVELLNHLPTGNHLQIYINPERDIPPEATAVHGITDEFVKDKPVFSQIYSDFLDFIQESTLIIHNAEFDMKFLNAELGKVGHKALSWRNVVDTLAIARKKFPGSPANLDALCRRFNIDNTDRTYHGALLDSELLAEVYLELLGGRQHGLSLASEIHSPQTHTITSSSKTLREPRIFAICGKEKALHNSLLDKIQDPIWSKEHK